MKIAILGFGTVGKGAYEASLSTEQIETARILVRRDMPGPVHLMTRSIDEILEDDQIDIVCECIGGIEPARSYILSAMSNGKHIVTANKALISSCYDELMNSANDNGVELRFTSSSGGGIPWLHNLLRAKRSDEITEISGIVNGTCNYILDGMHSSDIDFRDILKKAQDLGYAESDPTDDIEGFDSMRKCVISANIAFNTALDERKVPVIGISDISSSDISFFNEKGLKCKLMMSAGRNKDGSIYAYVEPSLNAAGSIENDVISNNNIITLVGKNIGKLSFIGQGAGKFPTGHSVIQDAIDISCGTCIPYPKSVSTPANIDNSIRLKRYYIRIGDSSPVITEPVSVNEIHARLKDLKISGESAFAAGYCAENDA